MLRFIGQMLYHIFALGENGFGLYYDLFVVKYPDTEYMWHDKFGGHFKFLSTQNMVIQTVYFLIALINDIIGTNEPETAQNLPTIRLVRDYYFAGLTFPISVLVTILFWSLYIYNRDAVLPPVFASIIPRWFNHVEHTVVSTLVLAELLICFRAYPDLGTGLIILYTYCLFYLIWLHFVKYYRGFWVYHTLNDMRLRERYLFFSAILLCALLVYLLGELINNARWSVELGVIAYASGSKCPANIKEL